MCGFFFHLSLCFALFLSLPATDSIPCQAFSQRLAPLVKRVVSPLQAPPEANPADQARGQEGPGRQAVAASLVAPRGNEREKFFSGFFLDEFSFDFWFLKTGFLPGW